MIEGDPTARVQEIRDRTRPICRRIGVNHCLTDDPDKPQTWCGVCEMAMQLAAAEARAAALAQELAKAKHVDGLLNKAGREQFERAEVAEEKVRALEAALRNFADPQNWADNVGCLQWVAKRHAIEYAQYVLSPVSPSPAADGQPLAPGS